MENLLLYIIIGLFALIVSLGIWVFILEQRIKKITLGKDAQSLEEIITETHALSLKNKQLQEDNAMQITHLRTEIAKSIQNISIVRFDALKDAGGMQSFAIALTDSHKTGVVISSMYTRDRMNVFAKEIIHGESKHTLTQEEKKVINK